MLSPLLWWRAVLGLDPRALDEVSGAGRLLRPETCLSLAHSVEGPFFWAV